MTLQFVAPQEWISMTNAELQAGLNQIRLDAVPTGNGTAGFAVSQGDVTMLAVVACSTAGRQEVTIYKASWGGQQLNGVPTRILRMETFRNNNTNNLWADVPTTASTRNVMHTNEIVILSKYHADIRAVNSDPVAVQNYPTTNVPTGEVYGITLVYYAQAIIGLEPEPIVADTAIYKPRLHRPVADLGKRNGSSRTRSK